MVGDVVTDRRGGRSWTGGTGDRDDKVLVS